MAFIDTLQQEISVIHKWLQHAAKTPQIKSFLFSSWAMNVLTCICLICNRPRLPRMNLMNRWASRHPRPHLIYLNTLLEGCSSSRMEHTDREARDVWWDPLGPPSLHLALNGSPWTLSMVFHVCDLHHLPLRLLGLHIIVLPPISLLF